MITKRAIQRAAAWYIVIRRMVPQGKRSQRLMTKARECNVPVAVITCRQKQHAKWRPQQKGRRQ